MNLLILLMISGFAITSMALTSAICTTRIRYKDVDLYNLETFKGYDSLHEVKLSQRFDRHILLPVIAITMLAYLIYYSIGFTVKHDSILYFTLAPLNILAILGALVCTYTDLKHAVIPNSLTVPTFLWATLTNVIVIFFTDNPEYGIINIVTGVLLLVMMLILILIFRGAIGGGDVKYLIACSMLTNMYMYSYFITFVCGAGMLTIVIRECIRKSKHKKSGTVDKYQYDKQMRFGPVIGSGVILLVVVQVLLLHT